MNDIFNKINKNKKIISLMNGCCATVILFIALLIYCLVTPNLNNAPTQDEINYGFWNQKISLGEIKIGLNAGGIFIIILSCLISIFSGICLFAFKERNVFTYISHSIVFATTLFLIFFLALNCNSNSINDLFDLKNGVEGKAKVELSNSGMFYVFVLILLLVLTAGSFGLIYFKNK